MKIMVRSTIIIKREEEERKEVERHLNKIQHNSRSTGTQNKM